MFRRIKNALKRGKSLVKFADVGSVGMPDGMADSDSDSDSEGEGQSDAKQSLHGTINMYSNSASKKGGVGSKRLRDEGEEKNGDKENEAQQQQQQPPHRQQRLVIENEQGSSTAATESRKRLADQLASKKMQVTDKRWETERATARLVELGEGESGEGDEEDWGVFNAAFYGQAEGGQKEPAAGVASDVPPGAPGDEPSEVERRQMREFIFSKVRHNHIDVVESCIRGKTHDLLAVDDKGNTLLHTSCQNNLKKMCMLLVREGGFGDSEQLNRRNRKGMTPLDYCSLYQFNKLGDWLVLQGAECTDSGVAAGGGRHK